MPLEKPLIGVVLSALLLGAAAPSPAPPTIADAVSEHTAIIDGHSYAYTARAGTITLTDQSDQPTATVFYTADTLDGADLTTRPITFIYNGGPGSSTMWLRMGSIGPVRVLAGDGQPSGPPPYRIVDNPYSLLDKSDLVFIDMPDSGFGRILPAAKNSDFFGVDQDVAAFGQFISRYISTFGRWNSPKFLFSESYGTTRSAALSNYLLNEGIALNGIVLQSSILNFGIDFTNGDPNATGDWAYVLYLPTEAATAWYHGKIRGQGSDMQAFLARVEQFAMGDYLGALYAGNGLRGNERYHIAQQLSNYLGIPTSYVLNSDLRVPYDRFQQELLRDQNVVVGRLDSRYTTSGLQPSSNEGPPWDPTDSSIDAPYTTAVNQYLRQTLGYNPPIPYRTSIYDIIYANGGTWDFSHNHIYPTNVAPDLAQAMTQNPRLKIFSANGYYDFATPFFATRYTLNHLEIAPALRANITFKLYPSGHMIYLDDAALAAYKADLSSWYDEATQ